MIIDLTYNKQQDYISQGIIVGFYYGIISVTLPRYEFFAPVVDREVAALTRERDFIAITAPRDFLSPSSDKSFAAGTRTISFD